MTPASERTRLADGRTGRLCIEGRSLCLVFGRGAARELLDSEPCDGDPAAARAYLLARRDDAIKARQAPPALPPVLGLIERARQLAAWVVRLDEVESEAGELRRLISEALS